jgi:tetratricopeptide (TPR) repeat protein
MRSALQGAIAVIGDAMMTALARCFLFVALGLLFLGYAAIPASAQLSQAEETQLFRQMAQAHDAGHFAEALPLAQQVLTSYERRLSPDDPKLAAMLEMVGDLHRMLGRTDEALALFQRALAIEERAFGPDHLNVGIILSVISRTLLDDDRSADAEPICKRMVAIAEKLRKPENISTALDHLAGVYGIQGRYAEAIPLAERALAEEKRVVKADDPTLANVLGTLGSYYHGAGRDAEAEPLLLRSVAIAQKAMQHDPNLFSDLMFSGNLTLLATLYRDRGRLAEAEQLYLESVNLTQTLVGPDHGTLMQGLIDLGARLPSGRRGSVRAPGRCQGH